MKKILRRNYCCSLDGLQCQIDTDFYLNFLQIRVSNSGIALFIGPR